jgi:dCMP deaminase
MKSHDPQTKCGCVLASGNTKISCGYNGFIRKIDNKLLPNTRPEKYPFMIHAEANAIYNAAREGKSTMRSTAYITSIPCSTCLQMLYQCGIEKIIYSNISNPKMVEHCESYAKIRDILKDKVELKFIDKKFLDIAFLEESISRIGQYDVFY